MEAVHPCTSLQQPKKTKHGTCGLLWVCTASSLLLQWVWPTGYLLVQWLSATGGTQWQYIVRRFSMALAFDTRPLRVVFPGACGGVAYFTRLQKAFAEGGVPTPVSRSCSCPSLSCLASPQSQPGQVQVRMLVEVQVQVQELVLVLVLLLLLVLVAEVELVLSSLPALAPSLPFLSSFSPSLLPSLFAASFSHTLSTAAGSST